MPNHPSLAEHISHKGVAGFARSLAGRARDEARAYPIATLAAAIGVVAALAGVVITWRRTGR